MRARVSAKRLVLVVVLVLCTSSSSQSAERRADVVVYGGTAAGVIAAVAAAREGKSVVLLEPGRHVGGMVSGGLGATDTGNRGAIGGYSREFFNRVREYYTKKYGASSQQVKDCSDGFRFEPHVAELIFKEMLQEAKVEPLFEQRLAKVVTRGTQIESLTTSKGDLVTGKVFIDASYEGDLMVQAGVKYTIGREGRSQYNESLAGVQAHSQAHQWPVPVSALDASGKLLPFIQKGPVGEPGSGDKKSQAYNFRLCMTDRKDNQVPFPRPANYDPRQYELLARYLEKRPDVKVGQLMNPVRMPNGKTDTNNNGPFSTDHIGANWDYPDANETQRARIWQDHVEYVQGFLYFLANDPRVPPALQAEMRSWGLAKDEFTDTAHWPHQLYVREARRMIGVHIMTQKDIMENRLKEDSVGLGSYNTDSHHVQRVVDKDGNVLNEGDFQVRVQPYAIPYRSLVPFPRECENLLVPVCCSASHVAYGTIRMEPVYMILGQASGVAAALAIDGNTTVQAVPTARLLARLKEQKAVLSPEELPAAARPAGAIDPLKLPGIVVDDRDAKRTGEWVASSSAGPFVGVGYLHDKNEDQGKKRLRFTPKIAQVGEYEVFLYYTPHSNRATNALVAIQSALGPELTVRVNQRKVLEGNKPLSLGKFTFRPGLEGWVEIRTEGTDGFVIGDAVQFVAVK